MYRLLDAYGLMSDIEALLEQVLFILVGDHAQLPAICCPVIKFALHARCIAASGGTMLMYMSLTYPCATLFQTLQS